MKAKDKLSFSTAKSRKTLWREVLEIVGERDGIPGPGASGKSCSGRISWTDCLRWDSRKTGGGLRNSGEGLKN